MAVLDYSALNESTVFASKNFILFAKDYLSQNVTFSHLLFGRVLSAENPLDSRNLTISRMTVMGRIARVRVSTKRKIILEIVKICRKFAGSCDLKFSYKDSTISFRSVCFFLLVRFLALHTQYKERK